MSNLLRKSSKNLPVNYNETPEIKDWKPYDIDGPSIFKKTKLFDLPDAELPLSEVPAHVTYYLQLALESIHKVYLELRRPETKALKAEFVESFNELRYLENCWRHFTEHYKSTMSIKSINDHFKRITSVIDMEELIPEEEESDEEFTLDESDIATDAVESDDTFVIECSEDEEEPGGLLACTDDMFINFNK